MPEHPLSATYRDGRERTIELGRGLDPSLALTTTTACPEWTIKDVFGHLAGISTDIIAGNTEKAATVEWADGHVADRRDRALGEVLDEWQSAGAKVSEIMETAGDFFPLPLFVDQFTHEWDIRSALGADAAATPDLRTYEHYLDEFVAVVQRDAEVLPALTLAVGGRAFPLGTGEPLGLLAVSLFEFARISMGRRSMHQLLALDWPTDDRATIDGWIGALVRWSVNTLDVIDPII